MPEAIPPPPPPTSSSSNDVWGLADGLQVHYAIRSPWQWIMKEIKKEGMIEVQTPAELPTAKLAKQEEQEGVGGASPPRRRRQRGARDKINGPSSLKIELFNPETGEVEYAVHGTSSALDGLEDKDELVRTIQRCRCEHLQLSPPSILINWDVTREECLNVVGESLPVLEGNSSSEVVAVLKEPMGSQGKGIFFVRNIDEIHKVISEQKQRAIDEPNFLDFLIEAKNRIPSWVLQAEVAPAMLIRDGRKFHIRTYIVVLEQPDRDDLLDIFIHKRHELRIAGQPVGQDGTDRDPLAHITNGALSTTTVRVLLHNEPEVANTDLQEKVELFVAKTFAQHLLPDISRRVGYSLSQDESDSIVRRFVVAGLDLMVTEDHKIYLLEANVHPAAPPEHTVDSEFREHLTGFLRDTVELVMGGTPSNFMSARDVIARSN